MASESVVRNRFVILTVPRTGSNMLCTLLNSHPDILCHHEVFNESGIVYAFGYRGGTINLGTMEERDRDPVDFMSRIWRETCQFDNVGFKLNNYQNPPVLHAVLRDRGVKKILLRRRNQVKTYVSWLIAYKLNQWELYRGEKHSTKRPKVDVDVGGLYGSVRFAARYFGDVEQTLRDTNQTHLAVTYEELFSDAERVRLLDYLEVPRRLKDLRLDSVKQNSSDLRDSVSNFSQLAECIRGTEFEHQLYDCGT